MSKKETEFDRYDRMKKLERENEAQKRKSLDFLDEEVRSKKGGKTKSSDIAARRNWSRVVDLEEEYDYV